jgi:hypothetical protein
VTAEAGEASDGCRNCGASLAGTQRFCGACGQRVIAARLTMRDIGHDFMHALTHADHSIFALAGSLLLRPGRVAREYIDGKRKKHFGPFAFLLIMVGLAAFMLALTGVEWFNVIGDSRIGGLLERHVNFVILLQTPLLAGWCALLFWEQRLHFAEHLVLSAYTSGFRILVLGLVLTPIWYFTNVSPARSSAGFYYYIPWVGYFAFAAAQFYRGNVFFIVLRAILVAVLSWATTLAIIFGVIVLFAYFASR